MAMSLQNILIAFFAGITFLSLIHGIVQGRRKNVFFLILDVIFWVIFYLTAPYINGSRVLGSHDLFVRLFPTSECENLLEFLSNNIADMIGADAEALRDEQTQAMVYTIIAGLIRFFYLILLAIVYYLVVKVVLYHFFFADFFSNPQQRLMYYVRKEEKYEKRHRKENIKYLKEIEKLDEKTKRYKSGRRWGFLSGAFRGAICSFLILCLINSTIGIIPDLNTSNDVTASNDDGETTTAKYNSIYDFIIERVGDNPAVRSAVDLIKDYQKSNMINATQIKVGDNYLDDMFADSITQGHYKDYTFAIREEMSMLTSIAVDLFYLTDGFDMENVNFMSLNNKQVEYAQSILTTIGNDEFVTNLATSIIGVAVTMEAVKEYLPADIQASEYEEIDWKNELTVISELVKDVYSLGDNLTELDYFNLDPVTVGNIFVDLSNLTSINFLAHVGAGLAIKQMDKDNAFSKEISSIEEKLVDLALDNKFSEDIGSFRTLYQTFIDLYSQVDISKYKDENGNVTNVAAVLTSIDVTQYSQLIDVVLETNFITEILPDVIELLKTRLPSDVSSILNPKVNTSESFKKEISTALQLVKELLSDEEGNIHPFEGIQAFDFSILSNFSAETILQSDLLSFAMIRLFIQASNGEGYLKSISNYIVVPDYLAEDYDANYLFNAKWYGENGELNIMLSSFMSMISHLKGVDSILASLGKMLGAIDSNLLLKSEVLYYSLDKMVKSFDDVIKIPESVTETSEAEIRGLKQQHTIKRSELMNLINTISNPNLFDFELLTKYTNTDENGNKTETSESTLDMSYDKIMEMLLGKKMYDPEIKDTTNLYSLFGSDILRCTLSYFIDENTSGLLVVPEDSYTPDTIIDESSTPVKLINKSEFVNLIKSFADLKIDISSLSADPTKMVEAFGTEDNEIKPEAKAIFGYDEATNSYTYDFNNGYCSILHATLSSFITGLDSSGVIVTVPSELVYDGVRVSGEEMSAFMKTLLHLGVSTFSAIADGTTTINSILTVLLTDAGLYDSIIIRATITNSISKTLDIPQVALEPSISSNKVLTKSETTATLSALEAIKNEIVSDYNSSMDFENISLGSLYNVRDYIAASYVMKATVTTILKENSDIVIPSEAYLIDGIANQVISSVETVNLIVALNAILPNGGNLNNVSLSGISVFSVYANKDVIMASCIIKASLEEKLGIVIA